MNLCVALAMAALRNPNMAIEPPTMLKIPKSDAPKEFNIRRVVYNEMNIVMPIFAYKNPVFFIIRLAVDDIYLTLKKYRIVLVVIEYATLSLIPCSKDKRNPKQ